MIFSFNAFGEDSQLPSWVKNNAKWWSEDSISDSEFISTLEYLINEGIIIVQIPLTTEVTAATTPLSDSERAQSFRVTFSGGDHFKEPITIFSYSKFLHFSSAVSNPSNLRNAQFSSSNPVFSLTSLPSHDKQIIYELIDRFVNPSTPPTPFNVGIEVLDGTGQLIQKWEYRRCQISDYSTFVDDNKETYRLSNIDDLEIRDITVFSCAGFALRAP